MLNWADYLIIAVLGLSVLVGLWRGLVSEVLALVVWIAAFWLAWIFGPTVAGYFQHSISLPSVRLLVGYGLCFVLVLLVGALVRFVMARLVAGTGLSGSDRLLGMFFGLARGVLLVALAVFLLGFTPATRDPWWRQSQLLPTFTATADWLGQRLPDEARRYLHPPPALARLPARLARAGSHLAGVLPAHAASLHLPVAASSIAPPPAAPAAPAVPAAPAAPAMRGHP